MKTADTVAIAKCVETIAALYDRVDREVTDPVLRRSLGTDLSDLGTKLHSVIEDART